LTLSIDDLYLPHAQLTALSSAHPLNPFLQQRGPPGTHDVPLGERLLEQLAEQRAVVRLPAYDKSAHGGRGDRVLEYKWSVERGPWDVVVLEGWCVGFIPVGRDEVQRLWKESNAHGKGILRKYSLEDLVWLDEQLQSYQAFWRKLDALVQVYDPLTPQTFSNPPETNLLELSDAQELEYVYNWRTQQEHNLIKLKGTGMSDEQVRAFVDSCAYSPSSSSSLSLGLVLKSRQICLRMSFTSLASDTPVPTPPQGGNPI